MNITTAKISAGGLSLLKHKLAPLNRKAKRLGLEPVTINVTGEEVHTWVDPATKIEHSRRFHHIEVVGSVPRINGWTVAARIEFTGTETGNFVITAPGVESVNEAWRRVENRCDHCGHSRRRRDLIVIRHEDGTEKIVGRNCLADYIRTTSPEGLIEWCDWAANVTAVTCGAEDEFWGGNGWGRCEPDWSLDTILKAASLCVRKLGWMSSKAAYELESRSTRDDVAELLNPPTRNQDAMRSWKRWVEKNNLVLTEHDTAEAAEARAWLDGVKPGSSDYLHNLCVLRELDRVPQSKLGLAVSIVMAAKKAREDAMKRKERQTAEPREFLGEVKQRLRGLDVTVKRIRSIESDFGVSTLIVFTCGNAELTWFASGDRTEEYREGESYRIDATVKSHEDDEKFGKSTRVNRVKKAA